MKMEKVFNKNQQNFAQILGIMNNTFKLTLVQKFSRIKVFNVLAVPIVT